MPDIPLISSVVDNDLCIACGACISACPYDVVEPSYNTHRGTHEIAIRNTDHCSSCSAPCDSVCPSLEVDFKALSNSPSFPTTRIGPVESVFLGYSPKHQFNGKSSSGGTIRILIEDALEQNIPVICLVKEGDEYLPSTLYNVSDLSKVPGSIYHSVSFTNCLQHIEKLDRKCLLVATSCQLEGILKYIKLENPSLQKKISLIVGLICGWMYSDHSIQAFSQFKGIQAPIHDAQYRGEDKVGLLKLWTNKKKYSFDRRRFSTVKDSLDFKASFSSSMNRLRCRVCENHVNVLADISVGDAWLERKKSEKLSVIITRTKQGEQSVLSLREKGKLIIEDGSIADIFESQSENLVEGHTAKKIARFLNNRGISTPKFNFQEGLRKQYKLSILDIFKFKREILFRKLIRKSEYKSYRLFYFLSHYPHFVKEWLKHLLNKGKGY